MNLKITVLTILIGLGSIIDELHSQAVDRQSEAWFLLLNNYEINDKWNIGNEFHWRHTNFLSDKAQMIIRPYVDYNYNSNLTLTAGYSYLLNFSDTNDLTDVNRPEHNYWEQITLKHKVSKVQFKHRYRLEHRHIGVYNNELTEIAKYNFTNRFRYRISINYPINEHFYFHGFNELWLNLGDKYRQIALDRNWLYGGIGRKINGHAGIELAYLYQFIRFNNSEVSKRPTIQLTVKYDFGK